MKWNLVLSALVVCGLCSQSYGYDLMSRMLVGHRHGHGCCETSCCEPACEPACCDPCANCEPACCAVEQACCDPCGNNCCKRRSLFCGLKGLFDCNRCRNSCDPCANACEPACCEPACEPACCDPCADACCDPCKRCRKRCGFDLFGLFRCKNRCRSSCGSCGGCGGCGGGMMDQGAPAPAGGDMVPPAPTPDAAAYLHRSNVIRTSHAR